MSWVLREFIKTVAYLLVLAYMTYLLEFPLILRMYEKKRSAKYIMRVSFLVNFITNILLNITLLWLANVAGGWVVIPLELAIVVAEAFMYRRAFDDRSRMPFAVSALANLKSFVLGLLILAIVTEF